MSGIRKISHLINRSGNLTLETMEKFLSGKLTPEEKEKIKLSLESEWLAGDLESKSLGML